MKSILLFALAMMMTSTLCPAQTQVRKKIITRVFWQDAESKKLSYANLSTTDRWHIESGQINRLDGSGQFGEMLQSGTNVVVPHTDGAGASFMANIQSGVTQVPHGNHHHWNYTSAPQLLALQPSSKTTGGVLSNGFAYFSLQAGGFTRIPINGGASNLPAEVSKAGGAETSLAISSNGFCYAAHAGSSGDGRVDIVNLNQGLGNTVGSIQIPGGGILSATANSGKVFFATTDGVKWIAADGNTQPAIQSVAGVENLKISGHLINEKNWILFSGSEDKQSGIYMLDATGGQPSVFKLPIELAEGLQLSAPKTKLSLGKRMAFVFQENTTDNKSAAQEMLTIIDLDPNRDQNFSDATVAGSVPVGSSKVAVSRGLHNICFDDYGRFAIFSEPADGLLGIMTLNDLKVRARFKVGGVPDRVVAVGSPEHFH